SPGARRPAGRARVGASRLAPRTPARAGPAGTPIRCCSWSVPPGAVYLRDAGPRNAVAQQRRFVRAGEGYRRPGNPYGRSARMLAAIGGIGIVGIIVVVLIVLAVLYFARRA